MTGCVREKTIRDYIYDLGRTELCHDYEAEAKRILAMYDEQEERTFSIQAERIALLERDIQVRDTIIRCLTESLNRREV
jgi:hypothetical protein